MSNHNEMPMQDAPASIETSYMMSTDEPFEGTITNTEGDTEDWVGIEMEAGTTYTITVTGTLAGAGGAMDTILRLIDSKGTAFMMNDDDSGMGGVSPGSKLEFTPEVSDTYYISVSTYRSNPQLDNSGEYTVTVTGVVVDPADGTAMMGTPRVVDPEPDVDPVIEYVSGNDKLTGTDNNDELLGLSGDDTLYGLGGDDELNGGADDDLLVGGPGADELKGGTGTDTIDYSYSPMGVTINLITGTARGGDADGDTIVDMGDDEVENVRGSTHDDVLTGNSRENSLWGLGGNDELDGGRRDDMLSGGAGDDMLDGGDGDGGGLDAMDNVLGDTASYAGSMMGVTVRLHNGTAMGGDAKGDTWNLSETVEYTDGDEEMAEATVADIENLTGSANADILAGDLRDNLIMGGGGDDKIYGGPNPADADKEGNSGLTNADTLHGGGGNDMIFGGGGDDILRGDAGDDMLIGGPGADEFYGGAGSDLIYADTMDTTIVGDVAVDDDGTTDIDESGAMAGDVDTVSFARVEDETIGENASDRWTLGEEAMGIENVIGTQGDDFIGGDANDNVIEGGEGADNMDGGGPAGDAIPMGSIGDTLSYESSDDWVRVTLNNTVAATASRGHASGDTATNFENIRGSAHDDDLGGNANNNHLWGLAGDDEIEGDGGNDTIEGGAGADELDGGYTPANDADDGAGTLADDDGNRNFETNTLSYASSDAGVTVNLVTASVSGGHAEGDTIATFERLVPTEDDENNEVDVATFANVTGSMHDDRLTGDNNGNHLVGGAGDDVLRAGAGMDLVIGGPGADTLDGGEDNMERNNMVPGDTDDDGDIDDDETVPASIDWAVYKHSMDAVTVDLTTNRGTAGDAMGDTLANIELIWGSENGDTFIMGPGPDIIEGDGGSDTVSYEESGMGVWVDLGEAAQHTTVVATTGDDPMQFPRDPDPAAVTAPASGLAGVPRLDAMGMDFDVDNVEDEDDNPNANGAAGDRLRSIENLTGSSFKDELGGDGQNNVIKGMGGNDVLDGGSGGEDMIYGGDGDDTITGSGADSDMLKGGAGDDTITGSSGDDMITGGMDDDTMDGNGGNDTYVFSPDDGNGDDIIEGGFDANADKIDLSDFAALKAAIGDEDVALADLTDTRGSSVVVDLSGYGGGKIAIQTGNDADAIALEIAIDDASNGTFIL